MLKVKEIMIRRVESVNSDQTIQDAILKMKSM